MTYTGPESSTSLASGACDAPLPPLPAADGRRLVGRVRADDAAAVSDTCGASAEWLRQRQAADGHWRGPLEGDTILESEYILLLAWAGRLDSPHVPGAVRRILREQLPDGGSETGSCGDDEGRGAVIGHVPREGRARTFRTKIMYLFKSS